MNCVKCKNGAKLTLVIFDPQRNFQEMYTYIYGICQNDGEKFVRGLNQKENKQIMQMQQARLDKKQIWEKKKQMRELCKVCHEPIQDGIWYLQVMSQSNKIIASGFIDKYCIKKIMVDLKIMKFKGSQTSFDDYTEKMDDGM